MLDLDAIEAREKAATPGPWVCRPTISTVGDEILEAVISKTAGNLTVANDCLGEDGDFIAHAREDIPALIAELRKLREENRWIPVTERLPEDKGYVLCGYGSGVLAAWFDGVRLDIDGVTHWRPLPKPPEVGS